VSEFFLCVGVGVITKHHYAINPNRGCSFSWLVYSYCHIILSYVNIPKFIHSAVDRQFSSFHFGGGAQRRAWTHNPEIKTWAEIKSRDTQPTEPPRRPYFGDICRVCRSEGTPEKPLYHPCVCTGSIKFIHQECLVQWLKHSRKEYCELCKHRFAFTPIYSPDMPSRLPIQDIFAGLVTSIGTAIRYWFHYTLVAFAWLGVVPLTACRIYKCLFTGSVSSLLTLPLDMLSTWVLVRLQGCTAELVLSLPARFYSCYNLKSPFVPRRRVIATVEVADICTCLF